MPSRKQPSRIIYRRHKTGVEISGDSQDVKSLIERDLKQSHLRKCLYVLLLAPFSWLLRLCGWQQ